MYDFFYRIIFYEFFIFENLKNAIFEIDSKLASKYPQITPGSLISYLKPPSLSDPSHFKIHSAFHTIYHQIEYWDTFKVHSVFQRSTT